MITEALLTGKVETATRTSATSPALLGYSRDDEALGHAFIRFR
jgi:hypothetical protein